MINDLYQKSFDIKDYPAFFVFLDIQNEYFTIKRNSKNEIDFKEEKILKILKSILLDGFSKEIYNKNRDFSLPMLVSKNILKDKKKLIKFLQNEHNDLQKTVSKIYPKISKIIEVISIQKGCHFSRLTGSGSACFGLFSSMSKATLAEKNIKKKFPKYWSVVSKSI